MATVQIEERFHAILSDLFADAHYVKKLAYDIDGSNVIVRAIFDEGDDWDARFTEIVRRLGVFEEMMWEGIMPDIELRKQVTRASLGWPEGIAGLRAVIDR